MKRLMVFLIMVCFVGVLSAQTSNWYRYQMKLHGGVKVGNTVVSTGVSKTGSFLLPVDSITTDNVTTPTVYKIYNGDTQLAPDIPSGSQGNLSEYAVMLLPDTVQHTDHYTVAASDYPKEQMCLKAASIAITIPPDLTDWPVGGTMNFWGEGAGIMVFKKGAGVTFISDTDSIATSRQGQVVSVRKIATNKYFLVGPLTD